MDTGLPADLLPHYGLRADHVERAKGTAGRTWRVTAAGRTCFVRRRGARTSAETRLRFDHGLRRYLAPLGPYVTPALQARTEQDWVRLPDGVYEVYPWVDGLDFQPAMGPVARRSAARALAWFHGAASSYGGDCEAMVPQFGHFAPPVASRPGFDHPQALLDAADQVVAHFGTPADAQALRRARDRIVWLGETYGPLRDSLPLGVIHGDYNFCNLRYTPAGEVVGVFDFDWAWRDTRVRDVGDGMLFFGNRRDHPPDGGDIWSLTACPALDTAGMLAFVREYEQVLPLSDAERRAVPLAMLGRWVAIRLEGVMKVPESRRTAFFLNSFLAPFEWYDREAAAFARRHA